MLLFLFTQLMGVVEHFKLDYGLHYISMDSTFFFEFAVLATQHLFIYFFNIFIGV